MEEELAGQAGEGRPEPAKSASQDWSSLGRLKTEGLEIFGVSGVAAWKCRRLSRSQQIR